MDKKIRKDGGLVIVEASIVFPVCFLIIIMLLYLGNVYYQRSRIEAIVVQAALDGAAYCADPLLRAIEENKDHTIPQMNSVSLEPYRYVGGLFGSMDQIEDKVSAVITERIKKMDTGLFFGMQPTGYNTGGLQVKYKSCFIASSISVDLKYKIEMPIRLLGDQENLSINFQTHTEVPVSDTPEFIRNVNMVEDLLESTGVKKEITDMIKKLKDGVSQFFGK